MKTSPTFCTLFTIGILSTAGIAQENTKSEIPAADADGWISLFNGKDLTGWEGMEGYWSVVDGAIQCTETKENSKQTTLILIGPQMHGGHTMTLQFKDLKIKMLDKK